jgi:hypothetical protein
MTQNKIIITLALIVGGLVGATVGVSLLFHGSASHASTLTKAAHQAVITSAVRDTVVSSIGSPGSPLAPDAADHVQNLFTPDDPDLPAFFTVPTTAGGRCIVTSEPVIGSCLSRGRAGVPGTVSMSDESTGDDLPPFVYGQLRSAVKTVEIDVAGTAYVAGLTDEFYLLKLPDPTMRVDDVRSVTFVLSDGRRVTRQVG